MTKTYIKALGAVAALLPATAMAQNAGNPQTIPNIGNYEALRGNYRIGVRVISPVVGPNGAITFAQREASFEQTGIEDIQTYLDPFELAQGSQNFYTNQSIVQAVFDIAGATATGAYGFASPQLVVNFIDKRTGGTLLGYDNQPCTFTYNGQTRAQSYAQFDAATDPDLNFDRRLFECLEKARTQFSPVNPLVGNPYSLQGTMTRTALDFTAGDSLVELGENANSAGDPWAIGATFSTGNAGRFDMTRIDVRVNKGWRVFEGNRARLKLDLPFSYTRIKGATAYNGQIGLGLEVPVIANRWSLEPRLAYGITYSSDLGSLGHIAQATVASRYVIRGLGRGQLMIGNLVGYSATLGTPGKYNINPDIKAWMFRNGASYELPLKLRVASRQTSLRASYSFTKYAGVKLYNNNFHEATFSLGLRGREDTPKAFQDTIRLNFNTIQARNFSTYTVGLGFRF